jgi:hypothetical protein
MEEDPMYVKFSHMLTHISKVGFEEVPVAFELVSISNLYKEQTCEYLNQGLLRKGPYSLKKEA